MYTNIQHHPTIYLPDWSVMAVRNVPTCPALPTYVCLFVLFDAGRGQTMHLYEHNKAEALLQKGCR